MTCEGVGCDLLLDVRVPADLVLFLGASSSSSSACSLSRFEEGLPGTSAGLRASSKTSGLAFVNASTKSCMAPLNLNFSSWSCVRHAGHFPSLFRHLRMHSEQNVCEQEVIIGVV